MHLRTVSDPKQQASALPYRRKDDGSIDILLITSKKSGKWIIPKGNAKPSEGLVEAAAREALEEAGIHGKMSPYCLGSYIYEKCAKKSKRTKRYSVSVYPLHVSTLSHTWQEQTLRRRAWYEKQIASKIVSNSDLSKIIAAFGMEHI